MVMSNHLSQWLANKLDNMGWSQRELARRAEISQGQISRVLSGDEPGQLFFIAIGKALGYTPESLRRLNEDGTPPTAYEEMSFGELEEVIKQLSPEDRAEVLEYAFYRLWRGQQRDSGASAGRASDDAAATGPKPSGAESG